MEKKLLSDKEIAPKFYEHKLRRIQEIKDNQKKYKNLVMGSI